MKKIIILQVIILTVFSCMISTFNKDVDENLKQAGKINITLDFSSKSSIDKTIVPDFTAAVDTFDVTLISKNGYSSKNGTAIMPDNTITFNNVEIGVWDITVTAKKNGLIVGTGSSLNQTLTLGIPLNISIPINFTQSGGKGNMALTISFPVSTGIDFVSGEISGTILTPSLDNSTDADYKTATFLKTNINSGFAQDLFITFKRVGSS